MKFIKVVNLQKHKACSPDCFPAYLLKISANFLAAPLSKLFQLSLSSGSSPKDWIVAKFIKKGRQPSHPTTAQLV